MTPVIEHIVDHMQDPETGELLFHYNYLLYTFTTRGGTVTARSHIEEMEKVALLRTDPNADVDAVIDWLQARFGRIDRLGPSGYVTIRRTAKP